MPRTQGPKELDAEEPNAKDARHAGKEADAHSAITMALGATFVPSGVIDVDSAVLGASWAIWEGLASRKNQNLIYRAAQNIPNTQEGLNIIVETMKRCPQEFEDCDEHIKESE